MAAPESLIFHIIGTQNIAVGQQRAHTMQINDQRVLQQGCATGGSKIAAHQQVAITVHQIKLCTACRNLPERTCHLLVIGVGQIIIARPILKQVTQDIQRISTGCRARKKIQQQPGDMRCFRTEVQVGNKKRCWQPK